MRIPDQRRLKRSLLDPDPDQPRRHFDESDLLGLGKNLLEQGQQVPLLVVQVGDRFQLIDGERRWRAASLAGITELAAIVLPEKPSIAELHVLRMSIDVHKVAHSAIERSDLLVRIQTETKWSVSAIADHLGMKQPLVSKLLAYQKLCPEVREQLHRGELDSEKALAITQEPDAAKHAALAKQAGTLSREQLRQRISTPGRGDVKTSAARFVMPGGMEVAVKGKDLTLTCVVEVLREAARILNKGLSQGLDITTQMRVMRDQSKERPKSAARKPA